MAEGKGKAVNGSRVRAARERWDRETVAKVLARAPERKARFEKRARRGSPGRVTRGVGAETLYVPMGRG